MKNTLLISVLLAFILTARGADALTVENVSVSDTGGVTVSGEAHATGSSEADAEVRSIIRTEGSNTRVRVEIRTSEDGTAYATTAERIIQGAGRFETRDSTGVKQQGTSTATTSVSADTPSGLLTFFDQLRASIERIFKFFFFW